jgi:hypothetical protein
MSDVSTEGHRFIEPSHQPPQKFKDGQICGDSGGLPTPHGQRSGQNPADFNSTSHDGLTKSEARNSRQRNGRAVLVSQSEEGWESREFARSLGLPDAFHSFASRGTSCVYFVRLPDGRIKIGYSRDLRQRFRLLLSETGNPGLQIVGWCHGTRKDEKRLHEELKAHALGGEWFEPAPAVLAALVREVLPRRTEVPEWWHALAKFAPVLKVTP